MQTFRAEIRDNVEVGANSVIDRGSWRDTTVDKGARLDSLVHIGMSPVFRVSIPQL